MSLDHSPFLKACRREETPYTPIWLMRQAGRYMKVYREIRSRYTMLETVHQPELAAEITLQPIQAFDLDAAIIFSDILPPLAGMGLELEFIKQVGPRIHNPVQTERDVKALQIRPARETMAGTLRAIELVQAELTPRGIPLIGFAGAPFTLASYAIEGGGSKTYLKTKSLMLQRPDLWHLLMEKLVAVQAEYLLAQAASGASALQIFDSWVGTALNQQEFKAFVKPYNAKLINLIKVSGLPVINFCKGTGLYMREVTDCGGDVIGVDWHQQLDKTWKEIGCQFGVQGNLDPAMLLAPWDELKLQVDAILQQAAGRPGHIFNLGHGLFPVTEEEQVRRLVDYVHEKTRKQRQ
ncbi:MAG: uroporphyrinogen decarboxylase [Acidobacteria bacterium]|nr:MAG: uroporphyrinogen decarboxylase [Acidobacteriota bacterium]PIE91588.1 MAG: uroporphyrinogen decarboxylase [Acidobacteriota bacterium]